MIQMMDGQTNETNIRVASQLKIKLKTNSCKDELVRIRQITNNWADIPPLTACSDRSDTDQFYVFITFNNIF